MPKHTFPAHAHFDALSQTTILALIPMVLIDGAISIPPTRIGEIPPDTSFEKALATWNKKKGIKHPFH